MDRLAPRPFVLRDNFASGLKRWRQQHRVPLKKLAGDLGFAISTIQAWENAARFPSPDNLELLLRYTGLAPCRLFSGQDGQCVPARCRFEPRPS